MRGLSALSAIVAIGQLSTFAAALRFPAKAEVGPISDLDPVTILNGTLNGTYGWGTFDQLLDHKNPSLGTFKQRYWYGINYWKGPGSPIIVVNPGEQDATGFNVTYTGEKRLTGLMAKELGGAVVVMEHRYWGQSSPYTVMSAANLTYLTLDNALHDITYLANNWVPPFDKSNKSHPSVAPWIFSGGSYSGALAGWLESVVPGTFWAYHSTSGVVEAQHDFWTYFEPVRAATPQNCSTDLNLVITYLDSVIANGTEAKKAALKHKFMLDGLDDLDFLDITENGPGLWQSTQFYTESLIGPNQYYQFCDYIEGVPPNSTKEVPGPEGVGLCRALKGYINWFTTVSLPGNCESIGFDEFQGEYNTLCFQNLNASNPIYHDLSVENVFGGFRQWEWMLCNEPFSYWQTGPPSLADPAIVSRLIRPEYYDAQCALWFPEKTYGTAEGKTPANVNAYTGGWSVTNTTRLMYANGQLDPWRDVTVSSDYRPGGPLQSTPQLPVRVIPGGIHCSDYYGQNWAVNPTLQGIVNDEVANMVQWVDEYYTQTKRRWPKRAEEWEA